MADKTPFTATVLWRFCESSARYVVRYVRKSYLIRNFERFSKIINLFKII